MLAAVLSVLFAGFARAGDKSGAVTGTVADVTAHVSGKPTCAEPAAALRHIKTTIRTGETGSVAVG